MVAAAQALPGQLFVAAGLAETLMGAVHLSPVFSASRLCAPLIQYVFFLAIQGQCQDAQVRVVFAVLY